MAWNLKKPRHFDTLMNFTTEEIMYLVDQSIRIKNNDRNGVVADTCKGKAIVGIFEKNSTRTANATFRAAHYLGMNYFYNGPTGSNMGTKESVADTANVFTEMYDIALFRTFGHDKIQDYAKNSGIPLINGLCDQEHPTQTIADLQTIKEAFGSFKGLKVVFCGDYKNNMGASWMYACAFAGMDLVMFGPKSYEKQINPQILKFCKELWAKNGGSISFTEDKKEAAKNANVIATDVWVSLGESFDLWGQRLEEMHAFQVDAEMMKMAADNVIFMHCLPAFHDMNTEYGKKVAEMYGKKYPMVAGGAIEVTDEVFSNKKWNWSFVEAGNRWTSIAAIIQELLK
ncbi:MAG: ornithine carbamoyltransferase [Candidatus Ureaplasma intestinipullorum]|uniref:Ornithine carbamoyltransferase n=1 Tax=Candidatus Ureaplasma intestinipullorum TaxID=2838770 RepID=A0A9E2KXB6_9BACT|nr:ornithine carbamoyltransferase [Candidatus Ureaplasma intestinipullorum]